MSSHGVFTSATAVLSGMPAEAVGAPGKHFAMHKTAIGQAFAQSGKAGFSSGQHGMPSDMAAISDMPAIDASSIAAAFDGVAIGAVRRPTIARTESKREMKDQKCTSSASHMEGPK